jgi:hypothetical protein
MAIMVKGKSLEAITKDIADGYVAVNPIFLKSFDEEALKGFYQAIQKTQAKVRAEAFPAGDLPAIRMRNLYLQRLHQATIVVRNFARTRRMKIF